MVRLCRILKMPPSPKQVALVAPRKEVRDSEKESLVETRSATCELGGRPQ